MNIQNVFGNIYYKVPQKSSKSMQMKFLEANPHELVVLCIKHESHIEFMIIKEFDLDIRFLIILFTYGNE